MRTSTPTTLPTTERGYTLSIYKLRVGDYIWHRGAFRLVTGVNGRHIRMGRHVLHCAIASTVEAHAS